MAPPRLIKVNNKRRGSHPVLFYALLKVGAVNPFGKALGNCDEGAKQTFFFSSGFFFLRLHLEITLIFLDAIIGVIPLKLVHSSLCETQGQSGLGVRV